MVAVHPEEEEFNVITDFGFMNSDVRNQKSAIRKIN